ncbi:hypothetical protein DFH27DRAFT_364997 [Peziza echinospora]|nr:hypothetical protein DFH27DRAFT_364997 [Peziza echinospora]
MFMFFVYGILVILFKFCPCTHEHLLLRFFIVSFSFFIVSFSYLFRIFIPTLSQACCPFNFVITSSMLAICIHIVFPSLSFCIGMSFPSFEVGIYCTFIR